MESQEACAQHSLTDDDALFWTFDKPSRKCWLKKSTAGRKNNTNMVSGNRGCGMGKHFYNMCIIHHIVKFDLTSCYSCHASE